MLLNILIFILKINLYISVVCNIITNCIIYPYAEYKLEKEGYTISENDNILINFLNLVIRGLIFFIPIINLTTTLLLLPTMNVYLFTLNTTTRFQLLVS